MKTTRLSFIIAVLIYGSLLLGGYWLFSVEVKKPIEPLEETRALPVNLTMFQSTPEPTPEPTPPETVSQPITEPMVEPETVPEPEPTPEPKVLPKPKPVPTPKPEPLPEPPPKPTPEPPKPKPVVEKPKVTTPPTPPKKVTPSPAPTVETTPAKNSKQPPSEVKPVPPQHSAQQVANAEQNYLSELRSEILIHAQNTYPRQAKRRQWQGVVTLSFTLLPNGRITGLSIQESSGRQLLDDAATSIVQQRMNNQFQAFPPEIDRKEWKISIPVSYHLY